MFLLSSFTKLPLISTLSNVRLKSYTRSNLAGVFLRIADSINNLITIDSYDCFWYTFYSLLRDAVGERIRMLYTDADCLFLHFFVEDLAKEINARPHLRDAFDFSEISPRHLSNFRRDGTGLHAREIGYFKNKTKRDTIVEFVGLGSKMYSVTLCKAF